MSRIPSKDVSFPDSVVGFFAGDLGQPPGGFPKALQKKVLKGRTPLTERPGSYLKDVDLEAERAEGREGDRRDDRRSAARLVPDVSKGLRRLRQDAGQVRPDGSAADAGLFLRARRRARRSSSRSSAARRW